MGADRIRHNLKQVVDKTMAQWGESAEGVLSPHRHQRYVDERGSDAAPWHSKARKENGQRFRGVSASVDLDLI